jgi:hypothetical protein
MRLRLLSLSVNNDHDFATAFAAIAKHKPCGPKKMPAARFRTIPQVEGRGGMIKTVWG